VRTYDEARDYSGLRRCVIELQSFERNLDPRLPEGSDIADEYIDDLLDQCRKYSGEVFVAEEDESLVGYACVWARARSEDPAEAPREYAYVKDLVVLPHHRKRGIGRLLLETCESYARKHRAAYLRVSVLAANAVARELYGDFGFREREIVMDKSLT
jgi:ribosomal protein S18 acetylase RimI-like enzyme